MWNAEADVLAVCVCQGTLTCACLLSTIEIGTDGWATFIDTHTHSQSYSLYLSLRWTKKATSPAVLKQINKYWKKWLGLFHSNCQKCHGRINLSFRVFFQICIKKNERSSLPIRQTDYGNIITSHVKLILKNMIGYHKKVLDGDIFCCCWVLHSAVKQ